MTAAAVLGALPSMQIQFQARALPAGDPASARIGSLEIPVKVADK
jgi:hypothetical protein